MPENGLQGRGSGMGSLGALLLVARAAHPVTGGQRVASSPQAEAFRAPVGRADCLAISVLANGPRNTSRGQTQEVSDTSLVFHSLGAPNS